jgi:UDP-N-acetylmuramate: L-alanyl-gamma-D-glutamyl-meso-diaminopimelate ligase
MPNGLLITSIEFDHADIYRDLNHVMDSFKKLVGTVPPDGVIIANSDDANVMKVVEGAEARVVTFGLLKNAAYHPESIDVDEKGTSFKLNKSEETFVMPLWGAHNLQNAVGVIALLLESGVSADKITSGLKEFGGVKRRQECIFDEKGINIIDDFAHHPTAVEKTIESMRLRFPGKTLWAVFEPRSNTSRRNFFEDEFRKALSKADRVLIAKPYNADAVPKEERLNVRKIASEIVKSGVEAHAVDEPDHIVEFIMRGIDHGDVILIMSNGAFDGIGEKLKTSMGKRLVFFDKDKITFGKVPR